VGQAPCRYRFVMTKRLASPRIALFGSGAQAQRWAWAIAEHASLVSGPHLPADAVVLAPGAQEPLSTAREALLNGIPVLWACNIAPYLEAVPGLLLSCSRRATLSILEPFQYLGGFQLLRRLLSGPEPFWQPIYYRMAAGPELGEGVEDVAVRCLSMVQSLLTTEARQVTAHQVRQEAGEGLALFLSVRYLSGLLLQCTVGSAETRDELVAVTQDRMLTLAGDGLRIEPNGAPDWAARERTLVSMDVDPIAGEARRFVAAVAGRDGAAGNGDRWLQVADLWSAVRTSLSHGGPAWVQRPLAVQTRTPTLRLVEAGGRRAGVPSSRGLTVVAG